MTAALVAIGFAATRAGAGHLAGPQWPAAHVFAPYFETYDTTAAARPPCPRNPAPSTCRWRSCRPRSAGSCTAYWNGDTSQPIAPSTFGSDISAIQAGGGNVIPSFGGYTADTTGTDIADSCTSVSAIAQVYENVITTYNVPRIDLDIEANSLTNTAGINRRNEAVAQVEAWAAATDRSIQFSYTMPSPPPGWTPPDEAVLQNAIADGATDQRREHHDVRLLHRHRAGDGHRHRDRRARACTASCSRSTRSDPPAQLWHMIGVTEMPGIDDFGPDETFTQADAATVLNWAQQQRDQHPVVLGPAAGQRRLPGHQGRGHLLRASPSRPGTSATPSSRSPGGGDDPPMLTRCT